MAAKAKKRSWDDSVGDPGCTRRWTHVLSRRMQAVLVAAVRGCDGSPKHDPSKAVLWALRWDTMNPSDDHVDPNTTSSFMGYRRDVHARTNEFLSSLDQYPFHFVMHLLHAAEICGYFHPDFDRRVFWNAIYLNACQEHLHVRPETMDGLLHRLRDEQ